MSDTAVPAEQTILFTDVEGSTQLRERLGDSGADEVLALHERIVRDAIARHAGREAAFLGDGFMASFSSPSDAVACAVDVQRTLDEHNRADPDRQVRVRIGVHKGAVTERDGSLFGQTVHAAARLAAQATGGQILVSDAVRTSAGDDVAFADRGLYWLKGLPERWRLFEVPWGGAAAAATGLPRTPLVERDAERADLRRSVDAALAGQGSLVLVAGEAGVGKTRLTLEVEAEAEARGMHVLAGHAIEQSGSAPYLPFVEILEDMLLGARSPVAFRQALGDAAPEIARLVPALRRQIPDLPPSLDLPPEQARRYLWVSVQEFLERASRVHPLLCVLEDLHWADDSTIALLEYLTPHLSGVPVLVVGTYRDVEVEPSHPLARTMTPLSRRGLVKTIKLNRLSEAGVTEMVRGLSGFEPPEQLVRAIQTETDGNPFFVEEVYLHLAETGVLFDADGTFRSDVEVAEFDVPQTVRVVLSERLERLSEQTRETLRAGALVGRTFPAEVAREVAQVDADALADALNEAERARLIAPADPGGARYAFSHELIRQSLLADASSVRRQRLHARAADAIERVAGDDLLDVAADLAYHLSLAGPGVDTTRMVRYLRLAGERALHASAFEDAVAHLERAAALVPAEEREERAAVLEKLAWARRSVGRWEDSISAMNEALELYEALGDTVGLGRLAWNMVYHLAWAARFPDAVVIAGKAMAAMGETPNPDRARLLAAAGWVFGLGGDYESGTETLAQGRALAEKLGDPRALADVLHMETIHHMSYAEFPQGVEAGLQAAEVFEREGALWDLASVLSFVEYQAGTMVDAERVKAVGDRAAPLARRLGHLGAEFITLANRVRTEGVYTGDLDVIERYAREIIDVCTRGALPWLYVGHLHLGMAAWWRDDREAAQKHMETAMTLEAPGAFSGQSASIRAVQLAYEGRAEESLALMKEYEEAQAMPGRVNTLGQWNVSFDFTEALYVLGKKKEAAANLDLIREALESGIEWTTFDGRLINTRAMLAAAAAGDQEAADRHFQKALEVADSVGNPVERAHATKLHARQDPPRTPLSYRDQF